tara:strand:+ start:50 stop:256 length:207 start_codon:yes stop_codon:yes gene_type:complete
VEVAQEETPQKNAGTPTTKAVISPPFLGGIPFNYLAMRLAFNLSIDGLIRTIEIQQAGRLLHHQGSIV